MSPHQVENQRESLISDGNPNRRSAPVTSHHHRSLNPLCQFQPNWPSDPGFYE